MESIAGSYGVEAAIVLAVSPNLFNADEIASGRVINTLAQTHTVQPEDAIYYGILSTKSPCQYCKI